MYLYFYFCAVNAGTSLKEGNAVKEAAQKLISDGLESKLISVLHVLLSATHPSDMVCLISCLLYNPQRCVE